MKRCAYEIGAEIIATLMHAPRTWQQVDEQVGMAKPTSAAWLRELRASGVIRICGYTSPAEVGAGKPARIFALQPKPFELPDAPYPGKAAA